MIKYGQRPLYSVPAKPSRFLVPCCWQSLNKKCLTLELNINEIDEWVLIHFYFDMGEIFSRPFPRLFFQKRKEEDIAKMASRGRWKPLFITQWRKRYDVGRVASWSDEIWKFQQNMEKELEEIKQWQKKTFMKDLKWYNFILKSIHL